MPLGQGLYLWSYDYCDYTTVTGEIFPAIHRIYFQLICWVMVSQTYAECFTVNPLACCLCCCLLCRRRLSKANFKSAYLCANCVHTTGERQICSCLLLPCLSAAAEWMNVVNGRGLSVVNTLLFPAHKCVAEGFVPWSVHIVFVVCVFDKN